MARLVTTTSPTTTTSAFYPFGPIVIVITTIKVTMEQGVIILYLLLEMPRIASLLAHQDHLLSRSNFMIKQE